MNDIFLGIGILLSIAIAVCFKKLISKHSLTGTNQEPAIIWTFAIFAGITVITFILLGVIPKITASCLFISGGKEFCIGDSRKEISDAKQEISNSKQEILAAKKEMIEIKAALEKSTGEIPQPVTLDDEEIIDESSEIKSKIKEKTPSCKPYVYTDGYTPSAGLILLGKEHNWFAIVSSIYNGMDSSRLYGIKVPN